MVIAQCTLPAPEAQGADVLVYRMFDEWYVECMVCGDFLDKHDDGSWRLKHKGCNAHIIKPPKRRPDKDNPLELTRNRRGLERALYGLGYDVRRNLRSQAIEWRRDYGDWRALVDDKRSQIEEQIAESYITPHRTGRTDKTEPLVFGRDTFPRALGAILYENRVDPFLEWLDDLPKWDGEPRLNYWLSDAFEIRSDDDGVHDLGEWASRFILMGAVLRAYQPAAKLDETPVLIGRQGIGKSTAIKMLLPPEHREAWFGDSLDLSARNKERAEALLGKVICEISELTGLRKAEIESMKSFLSRTDDGSVRLAYRRDPEPLPRRCVFVGTTNDTSALPNDPTGNRRFVAVELGYAYPVSEIRVLIDDMREQLWAEAKARVGMNEQVWLPEHLKGAQARINERYRYRDASVEDALDHWLDYGQSDFTTEDAAIGAGLIKYGERLSRNDQLRIANALRVMGYEQVRRLVDGKRKYVWIV